MTRDEILRMKAGDEINELIEIRLMGWSHVISKPEHWKCGATYALRNGRGQVLCPRCEIKDYSGDIERAWQIVEKMMSKGYNYTLRGNFEGNGKHWCGFDHQSWADLNPLFQSPACDTLPLAICKAALIAVMEDR